MKAISIRQPYASFVFAGIKTVENRTWKTEHRGRLLIHASGDDYAWPDANYLPQSFIDRCKPWIGKKDLSGMPDDLKKYHELVLDAFKHYGAEFDPESDLSWLREKIKDRGFFLRSQSIIGEVELVDIVKGYDDEFASENQWNWILSNPIRYNKPIWPYPGKVRLFEVDESLFM